MKRGGVVLALFIRAITDRLTYCQSGGRSGYNSVVGSPRSTVIINLFTDGVKSSG
jgi:hypothetical protein